MTEKSPINKVLFLDLDGVLNGHEFDDAAKSSTIRQDCVARLNRVLDQTGCGVVISSAWRYMILGGAVTLTGFEYLLRTHKVRVVDRLVGHTGPDSPKIGDPAERGNQIRAWLTEHPEVTRFAVVDDLDGDFGDLPLVRTNEELGLTDEDADKLIELLGTTDEGAEKHEW